MTEPAARTAVWSGEPERLDRVLARTGLVRSRSRAAELIARGEVSIDGAPAGKAGVRVPDGASVAVASSDRYVSRGAHKLLAGLDAFAISPAGRLALDLGASTGGFTQVLLERGARAVLAVDVGHDQLAPELRGDPRIHLFEGCNARDLDAPSLAAGTGVSERPGLVVADLSFISLALILPAIARCAAADAELLLLVKPQFEVGRVKDGVVTDPAQHAEAIRIALRAAAASGYAARGIVPSPIAGGTGNREFLVHLAPAAQADPTEWEARIAELAGSRRTTDAPGRARAEGGT
ncbi:TlyA family RNA methyltransferase [Leucobacter allii]|uniref:TlyA family RNA methyltransferase n=1 Tax=Leucobacter allii TaxID=2932247 RepID=UPI001FD34536|nr:TlyA family RNA methyltransferase [Leucobacter allii]UOR02309.1 TlyA family RNA methyltransferase [Leucobacter allii]